jgi:PKD repeat protein
MNIKLPSRRYLARLILAALGILALSASPALGAIPAGTPDSASPALLRLDLPSEASLARFAVSGLPAYAQLYTSQGSPYLLLPATAGQQALLAGLGFDFKILDESRRPGDYYLVSLRGAASLEQPGASVQVLEQDGRQALVKAGESQAEALSAQGMEVVRLQLHPVLPARAQPLAPQVINPLPVVQGMLDQVLPADVYNYDAGLSGEFPVIIGGQPYTITTRYSRTMTPIEKATQYTYEHFQGLGLPVEYHYYNLPGTGTRRNVIAEQAGAGQPERIFLVTAHLDSTSQPQYRDTLAPGADDNASGSVGVLIAANILSQYSFDCTIRYALFTGEEQGLYGSAAYAQYAHSNGDAIEGVLNLDMIAYNTPMSAPVIELHTRPGNAADLAIANLFADVVDAYSLNLTPQIEQSGISASDHYSFWQQGYPAILGIEDFEDFTPWYHTINDTVGTLNINYFTNFVKAAVGSMAHMGCLKGALAGQVTDAESSAPVAGATVTAEQSSGGQSSTQTNISGDYLLRLDWGTYTVTADAVGYIPYITTGINITSDITTTLDIALQPCHPVVGQDFTFSPANPTSGQTVTFTGTVDASATPPVSYSWDFGDGQSDAGQIVTHTYPYSSTYSVVMTASNCGGAVTATHPVQVVGFPGISISPPILEASVPYGQALTQTLSVFNTGEKPLTYTLAEQPETVWLDLAPMLGAIPPQSSQTVVLTYTAPLNHGVYTSSLALDSNDPAQPQIIIPVSMQVPCAVPQGVQFYFSPENPGLGEPVAFAGGVQSGSLPITYTWNFQDGSDPVSLVNTTAIEHTFPVALAVQSFPVTLAAQNTCSAAVTVTQTVTISPQQVFLPLIRTEPAPVR